MNPLDLHAYADNQLPAEEKAQIRNHIESDPQAQAEVQAIQNLKRLVSEKCEPQMCEVTWSKCVGRMNELDKAKRVESFVGRYSWALSGIFFLAIVGGGMLNRGDRGVHAGDVARYASLLQSAPATGGSGLSPQTQAFRAMIEGGIERQQGNQRPTILNAAEIIQDGRRMMRLRLADPKGTLTLLSIPGAVLGDGMEPIGDSRFHAGMIGATNCVSWQNEGSLMVIVANRPYSELVEVAEKYCCNGK